MVRTHVRSLHMAWRVPRLCDPETYQTRGWYGTLKIATFYAPDVVSGLASKVSGSMAMAIFRYTLVAV